MSARAFAQNLLANRVRTFHEMCHRHVIPWLQPAITITVEQHLTRDVRSIAACCVPQPAIEENSCSRLCEHRCSIPRVGGFVFRHRYCIELVTARYYREVATPPAPRYPSGKGNLQRYTWPRVSFQFKVQAPAILVPTEALRFWCVLRAAAVASRSGVNGRV